MKILANSTFVDARFAIVDHRWYIFPSLIDESDEEKGSSAPKPRGSTVNFGGVTTKTFKSDMTVKFTGKINTGAPRKSALKVSKTESMRSRAEEMLPYGPDNPPRWDLGLRN